MLAISNFDSANQGSKYIQYIEKVKSIVLKTDCDLNSFALPMM